MAVAAGEVLEGAETTAAANAGKVTGGAKYLRKYPKEQPKSSGAKSIIDSIPAVPGSFVDITRRTGRTAKKAGKALRENVRLPSKLPMIENGRLTKVSPQDAQRTIIIGLLAIAALHLGLSGKLGNLVKLAQ